MKIRHDPLIAEVRSARMELSARFGHDLRKLCAFLRKEERKHAGRLFKPARASGLRRRSAANA